MAFKLGDIIIDRIQYGLAEDFAGNPLYSLTQLTDSTINISAESKEAKDNEGTLIKKFWQGKTGTYEAKNAMLNVDIMGAASGTDPVYAADGSPIEMPKIINVKKGTTATLADAVEGSIICYAYNANGSMGTVYTKGAAANETNYTFSENTFTPPTAEGVDTYVVKYKRKVKEGVAVYNKSDKFPNTVRLTLKALCVDPCETDTLRACYIVLPSFQVSPEISIGLQTDSQLDYKGDLQVAYCAGDKTLYEFYYAPDDEEE